VGGDDLLRRLGTLGCCRRDDSAKHIDDVLHADPA